MASNDNELDNLVPRIFLVVARAEEDPGKINTAEKRLRMHQIMKIWRGI
jgi:hypothetical protein